MEEAQRLLAVSVWKLYRCRLRRGGLRLHRSLQLSLLVRAARHRYLSARAAAETLPETPAPCGATPEPGDPPSGDPRAARGANEPTAERPEPPSPRSDRTWGSPRRDCTGDPPDLPSGAPRTDRDRGCPPCPPAEGPPSPPTGASPAPRTAEPPPAPDPANRDPPSAAGAPRAGQKRRSSGSEGPAPGPVPSKRARLEAEAPPLPPGPPGRCSGPPAAAFGFLVRAVGAC
ncbi:immediate early response gene 2 protein [Prinia subflava]|uniref:immediate early response gene 2 protein n=1 Tax=Prinia subflava TaxID=208062 RepID=UPI002FE18DDB